MYVEQFKNCKANGEHFTRSMIYCFESISTMNISSSIVASLPGCPLDSLSYFHEQKERKELGKD